MNTFSIGAMWHFAWETFTKRGWYLVGVTVLYFIISTLLNGLTNEGEVNAMYGVLSLIAVLATVFLELCLTAFSIRAHDDVEHVQLADAWRPRAYWNFLGAGILQFLIIGLGLVLLIVPGLIAISALLFTPYLVVDRGMGPIAALKESARITRGSRWKLFGLLMTFIAVNFIGALFVGVGLLITVPLSSLAMVHAYRALSTAHTA